MGLEKPKPSMQPGCPSSTSTIIHTAITKKPRKKTGKALGSNFHWFQARALTEMSLGDLRRKWTATHAVLSHPQAAVAASK